MLLELLMGKSVLTSANDLAIAYAELEQVLNQLGVKDATFLFNEPQVTNSFKIEAEFNDIYRDYREVSLNFEYDELEQVSWINFLLELKKQDLSEFISAIENNDACIFSNEILENNLYVGEYPHLMITLPYGNQIRLIVFALEDCASDEMVLSDVLINKQIAAISFKQAFYKLENL